ncbi:MAG: amidohydrolase family protein [Chloroflexota bacterium]
MSMIIDCDTHFFPPDAFDHIEGPLAERAPRLVFDGPNLKDIVFPDGPCAVQGATPLPAPGSGARYDGMSDASARMGDYTGMGINRQLVLPQFTGWWSYGLEPALGVALAHSWNVAMKRMADAREGVYPVALVALQDVDASIAEVRWAKDNGFPAVVIDYVYPAEGSTYGMPTACRREVWPFFAACEELDMPVFLHAVQHGHRLNNLLNFQLDGLDIFTPSEPQMNLVAMITTGLLDRHPGLKIVHAEQGAGYIRPIAEWLDRLHGPYVAAYEQGEGVSAGWRRKLPAKAPQLVSREDAAEKNRHLPSHYFRTNFYWTIETEEDELVDAIAFVGADRFLFATDYPHDDPGGLKKFEDVGLLAANPNLSEDVKEQLRWRNAAAVFNLPA